MGNLDCARAVRMCRLFWAITGNLVSYQRPPLQAPLSHNLYCRFFACNKCQTLSFGRNKLIPNYYAYMHANTHAYIRTCTATYLRTYVRFTKPVIEVCLNPCRYMGFRCLSHHMRAAKAQTSLCIHAASPEPLLLSYTKQIDGCR